MHTLHWIAVEAESVEQAYDRVKDALQGSEYNFATWSDWHVLGGGRWNSRGEDVQYNDDPGDTICYKDNPEKFIEIINSAILRRQTELLSLMQYMKQAPEDILYDRRQKFMRNDIWPSPFIEERKLDMEMYYLTRVIDLLDNRYCSDSGLYDLVDYSANLQALRERILDESVRDKQYLVPVDFHF